MGGQENKYSRGSPNNAIKENERASKGTPFEALIRPWNRRLFSKGFNKELPSGIFRFPEF